MVKYTELNCDKCKKRFQRESRYYRFQLKKGQTEFFCSKKCSGTSKSQLKRLYKTSISKTNRENLRKWNKINHQKDEFTPFRLFMNHVKKRKKTFNREYDIDHEYLKGLYDSQNGICPISGIKMHLKDTSSGPKRFDQASLDRIDNSMGYIKGNVRFICLMANYMRNRKFSDYDMIDICKDVSDANY